NPEPNVTEAHAVNAPGWRPGASPRMRTQSVVPGVTAGVLIVARSAGGTRRYVRSDPSLGGLTPAAHSTRACSFAARRAAPFVIAIVATCVGSLLEATSVNVGTTGAVVCELTSHPSSTGPLGV